MFSAPKLLIILGVLFLLVALPAMAALGVSLSRKEPKDG